MTKDAPPWRELTLTEIGLPKVPSLDPSRFPNELFELYSVPSFANNSPEKVPGKEIGSTKQIVEPGDVLLCKIVPHLVRVWCVPLQGSLRQIASSEWIVVRPNPDLIDNNYLRYALSEPVFRSQFMSTVSGVGGSLMRARPKSVAQLHILFPTLTAQRRIVAALDEMFARSIGAREQLVRAQRLMLRYTQAVLDEAFIGQLTAGWRKQNKSSVTAIAFLEKRKSWFAQRANANGVGRDEKSAGISRDADLSRDLQMHAAAEPLPETWTWGGVGEAFGVYIGSTPSRGDPSFWGGDIPWVSSGEVAFCRITATKERITSAGLSGTSTRLHPPGTVLLGMIGEGKTRGQAAILDVAACNNQNCAAIRVMEADYPPDYLYWFFYSVYEKTRAVGSGNNQPALNKDRVQRLAVPIAPPEEAAAIVKEINSRLNWSVRVRSEIEAALKLLTRFNQAALTAHLRSDQAIRETTEDVLADNVISSSP